MSEPMPGQTPADETLKDNSVDFQEGSTEPKLLPRIDRPKRDPRFWDGDQRALDENSEDIYWVNFADGSKGAMISRAYGVRRLHQWVRTEHLGPVMVARKDGLTLKATAEEDGYHINGYDKPLSIAQLVSLAEAGWEDGNPKKFYYSFVFDCQKFIVEGMTELIEGHSLQNISQRVTGTATKYEAYSEKIAVTREVQIIIDLNPKEDELRATLGSLCKASPHVTPFDSDWKGL